MLKRVLSKEMEEKAVIEFNETPSKREETLKSLEGWLKENLHINLQRDTLWLLNFIRGCDFDTQQTQNMLKNYLTLKDFVPEIVDHQDPLLLDLQDVMQNRRRRVFLENISMKTNIVYNYKVVVDLAYVLRRRRLEQDLSAVRLETGTVNIIRISLQNSGNISLSNLSSLTKLTNASKSKSL